MYQQQKKRAGRRGQRRMPVDLETPNAFAARKCTDAATPRPLRGRPSAAPPPPFVRTLHARSRWAGRAIADVALRAVCGSLSRAKRRTERTTRCREREAGNRRSPAPPPRRGFAVRPLRGLHFSLHSTARNLQLGARIATRNPQLASKRGRPMHPRAPKMRLISVQMFHVKHSDLNLRFSHARRPPPRRHPSVGCRAVRALASPAAAHRAPSATHIEPRPPRPLRPPRRLPHRDAARPPHAADPIFAPIAAQRDSRRASSASHLPAIASDRSRSRSR